MVAAWEFFSLATMLIQTHGDEAEVHAADKLEAAEARNDRGEMVVWGEVIKKLAGIRAEQAQRGK